MKETNNFKLKLPEDTDTVTPAPFNENFAVVDQKLKQLEDGAAQMQTEMGDFQISDDTAKLLGLDPAAHPTTDDGFLAAYCLAKGGKIVRLHVTCGGKAAKAGIPIAGATRLDGSPLVTDGKAEMLVFAQGSPATLTTPVYLDMAAGQIVINTQYNAVTEVTWALPVPTAGSRVFVTTESFRFSPYATGYDVCCAGGGGGGCDAMNYWANDYHGGGGGGGYVSNTYNLVPISSATYTATIGAGGPAGARSDNGTGEYGKDAGDGGITSLTINGQTVASAAGGKGGYLQGDSDYYAHAVGGLGNGAGGAGGSFNTAYTEAQPGTVHRFDDPADVLYGGGGGGGGHDGAAPYGGDGATGAISAADHRVSGAGKGPGGGGGGGTTAGENSSGVANNRKGASGARGELTVRWRVAV